MEKKRNPFLGIVLTLCPMVAAIALSLMVQVIAGAIYGGVVSVQLAMEGITDSAELQNVLLERVSSSGFISSLSCVVEALILLLGFLWYRKWKNDYSGRKNVFTPKYIGFALAMGLAFQFLVSVMLTTILSMMPSVAESYSNMMGGLVQTSFLQILLVGVLAPFAEEMIFRGVTFKYARETFGIGPAVMISALLFSLFHLQNVSLTDGDISGVVPQLIYALIMGIVFALIVVKFNSVWASIFVHMVVNLSAVCLSFLPENFMPEIAFIIVEIVLGMGLCALALVMLKKSFNNEEVAK